MNLTKRQVRTIVVILVLAILVGYFGRPEGRATSAPIRSSFRTTSDGVAAFYRGLPELGIPTARRLTPWADAAPVRGAVVLLEPRIFPSAGEVGALLDHIRLGGTLLFSPKKPVSLQSRNPLLDSLRIFPSGRPSMGLEGFTLGNNIPMDSLYASVHDLEWRDHRWTAGLSLPGPSNYGFRVLSQEGVEVDSLLAGMESSREVLVAGVLRMGEGQIIVLADAEPLSNGTIAEHPLAVVAVRSLLGGTSDRDTLFFSEFHQGMGDLRSPAQTLAGFFFGSSGGQALTHAIAIALLALLCAGLRFGSPKPAVAPPDRERRSPLEYVMALGDLYRRTEADQTAALLMLAPLARTARRPQPRNREDARELLDVFGEVADPVRKVLAAKSTDLVALAASVDELTSRRSVL